MGIVVGHFFKENKVLNILVENTIEVLNLVVDKVVVLVIVKNFEVVKDVDSIVPNIFEILILSIFIKHLYYIQEIIPDYVVSINHKETVEEDVPILDYFDDGLLKKGN